jgi:hypothetical protein
LEQQWKLAKAWCGELLEPTWRRKTVEETKALFDELGLTSSFWELS